MSMRVVPRSLAPGRARWGHRACSISEQRRGFTLIEVVLVMTMLVLVLAITYGLLLDCLDAERRIEKMTLPEKVGEGILSLIRQDLSGTIYRNMGTKVFLVTDGGAQPEARDEIRFLSTVEPTPREDSGAGQTVAVDVFRTITGVGYFLRPSPVTDNVTAFTLFRKEINTLDNATPLDAPGMNYEIYDKVKSLSFECFDGWEWVTAWDSESRILDEEARLQTEAADQGGIARVSDPARGAAAFPSSPGVMPASSTGEEVLPPAAIPLAVRIEIAVYVGIGGKIERDPMGNPAVKTYSTIVPILAAQRIPIEIEDEASLSGVGGEGGAAGTGGDFEFGGALGGRGGPGGPDMRGGPGGRGGRGGKGQPRLGGAQAFEGGPGSPGPRRGGARSAQGGPGGGAPRGGGPGSPSR
jgi:prepilin-type N-terminal cleavage/methylation domain-containing protein